MKSIQALALILLVLLCATGCVVPRPEPPDVKMSDGPIKPRTMTIHFSIPHAIINPKAIARFRIQNYKACVPHGRNPTEGDAYPKTYSDVPLDVIATDDSIQLTANLLALRDEDYYQMGICNWALERIEINYETSAPAAYYQGQVRHASGAHSSGSYPTSYCTFEGVWMNCCDREGKCSKSPKSLPLDPIYRVSFGTDGTDQEFDLSCSQSGCYYPSKAGFPNGAGLYAHARISSDTP